MWRKNDRQPQDMETIIQRLRDERPEASGLELDRVKTTAMRGARSKGSGARFRSRRLAVIGLTLGLSAAGTGGVLAAGGASPSATNAASAQYSTSTVTSVSVSVSTVTASTVTASTATASGEVKGAKEEKAATSDRKFQLHFTRDRKGKLKELKILIDGKLFKIIHGNKRFADISFAGIPCSSKKTPVVVKAVFANGKTVSEKIVYKTC